MKPKIYLDGEVLMGGLGLTLQRNSNMTDRECLIWIHQRLVKVHGESKFVDYMHRLREVIYAIPKDKDTRGGVITMKSTEVLDEIENMKA